MSVLKDPPVDLDEDRAGYEQARASGEIGADVTFEKWSARPADTETHEEFLQSLRESIADADAGIGLVDAREFLEQWGREIAVREAAEEARR